MGTGDAWRGRTIRSRADPGDVLACAANGRQTAASGGHCARIFWRVCIDGHGDDRSVYDGVVGVGGCAMAALIGQSASCGQCSSKSSEEQHSLFD
jgi:hypothetical protein